MEFLVLREILFGIISSLMYYEQKLSHSYCTHSSYIVCALCDSMPCSLANISITF